MNLKYSGFLFVLIVILEAISGLALNNLSIAKNHTQDLSTISEKPQSENGSTTESVKIIIHSTSEVVPKSKLNETDSLAVKTTIVNPAPTSSLGPTPAPSPAPTQTPASSPAPSPAPAPTPVPEMGHWVVRNSTTNTICIIADMTMQLNITYPGEKQKFESAILKIPRNATVNGSCMESLQSLNIFWGPGHSLQINFKENTTADKFFISEFVLNVNATVLKNDSEKLWHFANSSSGFMTPLEMSYKCSKVQDINLECKQPNLKAVLSLKDTQFEAYMNKTKPEFGAVQDCDTFDTPDIVPIAVGCALAILVLVVLVAYLIGRKRSQNRGYLSMLKSGRSKREEGLESAFSSI